MSNRQKYYIYHALWAVVNQFISGGMIQTLFAELGFSLSQISSYCATISSVQMTMAVINIFLSDRIKNVKRATAFLLLSPLLLFLSILPICFQSTVPADAAFHIICIAVVCTCLFLGIQGIFIYRLHFLTLDMNEYTDFSSKATICGGSCSIGAGMLITALSTVWPFRQIGRIMLILCCIFCVTCCILIASMKVHPADPGSSTKSIENRFSFKNFLLPYFRWFYLPNYLRGIGMGIINSISVICIKEITDNASFVSGLVTLLAATAITGSLLCNRMRKKFTPTGQYVWASMIMAVLLPLSVLFKAPAWFAVLLFMACTMYNVIAVVAAVHAAEVADYENIGMYTSVRMICMSAGQATASALLSAFIDHVPGMLILLLAGLCQAGSALLYHLYEKKYLLKDK